MVKKLLSVPLLLLPLFLLFFAPGTLRAEEPEQKTVPLYQTELQRLIIISSQLETLNGQLKKELTNSRNSSQNLKEQLTSLQLDASSLKIELSELKAQLETSSLESETLKAQLTAAGNSLQSLQESFETYKKEVQKEQNNIKMQRNIAIGVAVAEAVIFGVIIIKK